MKKPPTNYLTLPNIKVSRYALMFLAGLTLPAVGTLGRLIGIASLVLIVLVLVSDCLIKRNWKNSDLLLIGFLCGSEIFFRDFALKGLIGYLAVEYILIILGIMNLPFLLRGLSNAKNKSILFFWFLFCVWTLITLTYSRDVVAGRWFASLYIAGLAIFTIATVVSVSLGELSFAYAANGVVLGSFLVLGTALYYYVTSPTLFLVATQYRFAHALSSPNQIAITLASAILALMYLFLERAETKIILPLLALFTALIATFSRGVLLGVSISMVILLVFFKGFKYRALVLMLLLLLIPISYLVSVNLSNTFQRRYKNLTLDSERVGIWYTSLDAWKSNPIIGYGIGSWASVYPSFSPNYLYQDAPDFISDAHNMALQILVETGSIGLSLFLLFIVGLTLMSIKQRSPLVLAILSFVIIVGGLENWKISILFLLVGLAVAINCQVETQHKVLVL